MDDYQHLPAKLRLIMKDINMLAEEVFVPPSIGVAVSANRPELLAAYKPDTIYTQKEVLQLVNLIRVLMITNQQSIRTATELALNLDNALERIGSIKANAKKIATLCDMSSPQ